MNVLQFNGLNCNILLFMHIIFELFLDHWGSFTRVVQIYLQITYMDRF